jgi:hypothetical protein
LEILNLNKIEFLKASYLIAGVYDLLLGLFLIFLRNPFLHFINHKIPLIPILADSLGLFLLAIGFLLLSEIKKDEINIQIGLSSVFVRFSFSILVFYYFFFREIELLYIILAITDFLTGVLLLLSILTFKTKL